MYLAHRLLIVALCLTLTANSFAQGNTFKDIRYQGGTVQTKVKPDDWDNRLTVTSDEIRIDLEDGQAVKIDPKRVTGLSYGQEAHRRVGTMITLGILFAPLALFGLFHKTRLHYVGIEFNTADDKKAGLLLQAHKDNYRAVLVALRGATGAPIAVASEDRKYVPANVEVLVSEKKDKENNNKESKAADAAASPVNTGAVKITSDPPGADVTVDGAFMGNTPAQLKLTAGKHRVQITNEGFSEWSREIQVSGGSEVSLTATLKKTE
jgi:PEGA domain-containing protein